MTKRETVFQIVSAVPHGKVITYGRVGYLAQVHPRTVGRYLHQNPDQKKIPCHRVVNRRGELADNFAFGGRSEQEILLSSEGIFLTKGRVDLTKYFWSRGL